MRTMACLFLMGCSGGSDFSEAVPDRSQVALNVPGESTTGSASLNQALLGERAKFYVVTRQTTSDFNNGVGGFLANIENIVQHPPSQSEGAHAVWGPTNDALAMSNYRFEAEKTA